MNIEDVKPGMSVRAAGYDSHGDELRIVRRPDAPVMVVREVFVQCSWFVDGVMNSATYRADELESVVK